MRSIVLAAMAVVVLAACDDNHKTQAAVREWDAGPGASELAAAAPTSPIRETPLQMSKGQLADPVSNADGGAMLGTDGGALGMDAGGSIQTHEHDDGGVP